jgi:hypothetical protein
MNETPKKKSGWRIVRRILVGIAVLATLVALLYAEEDWRGKRAWENCKRELEAKGAVLDWNAYIPPPVPDDQNFFKAPKMTEWFQRDAPIITQTPTRFKLTTNELSRDLDLSQLMSQHQSAKNPVTVAELEIVPKASDANGKNVILQFDDPAAREQSKELIQNATGPSAKSPLGFSFTARPLNQIQPAHIVLQATKLPSLEEVTALFPADTISTNIGNLRVESGAEASSFHIFLVPHFVPAVVYSADEFLLWSDHAVPDFDLIREALKRPYARLDGDYSKPFAQPIPNFIAVRAMAQMLASRAQCDLLLGQPDKALQELTLMHDFRHLLEAAPSGKPMPLVSAMINVAVTGLYVDTLAGGLQSHAWQEPQLAALQEQLADINLTTFVSQGFRMEQVGICRDVEVVPLLKLFSLADSRPESWFAKVIDWLWPRGWTYQNMVNITMLDQKPIDGFDLAHDTVAPRKFDEATRAVDEFDKSVNYGSPYKILAAIAIPNFSRAEQTTAHTQTMVNEAQIVCALDRYHLAHGEYPEALDKLAPQFIEKIPHDIIGGQPLHYRRTDDGKFLLYSVGWNETDDGGVDSSQVKSNKETFAEGDWVWKN